MMLRVVVVGVVLVVDDNVVVFVADVWECKCWISSPSAIAESVRLDFLISISMDSIA